MTRGVRQPALSEQQIEQVMAMRQGGFTIRRIATKMGISRDSVRATLEHKRLHNRLSSADDKGRDGFGFWPAKPGLHRPVRCPTCGGKVYMPCRLCLTEKAKRRARELRRQIQER